MHEVNVLVRVPGCEHCSVVAAARLLGDVDACFCSLVSSRLQAIGLNSALQTCGHMQYNRPGQAWNKDVKIEVCAIQSFWPGWNTANTDIDVRLN